MKKLIYLLVLASSLSAWSVTNPEVFNKTCATTYRTGTKDILKLIKEFNNKKIDTKELAAQTSSVTAQIIVARATCHYFESPEARACSDRYKEVYFEARAKVSAGALLTGTQTEVEAGRAFAILTEGKLFVVDIGCQQFN